MYMYVVRRFENAMRHAGSEELDELKKKQHSISQQYDQLQERWVHVTVLRFIGLL